MASFMLRIVLKKEMLTIVVLILCFYRGSYSKTMPTSIVKVHLKHPILTTLPQASN